MTSLICMFFVEMQIPPDNWKKLTHKQRRTLISKERRRRKRKELVIQKEAEQAALESQLEYIERLVEEEQHREEDARREEAQRQLELDAWLARERVAQAEFKMKREREEMILREREERERLIREEWEAIEKKEREEEEKRERARRGKEERLKEALSVGERPSAEPWHNPLAPDSVPDSVNYGTEKDAVNCSFFLKTGSCRFGERCSRHHPRPSSSTTLLISGMYSNLGFAEQMLDERDHDVALEYDEGELYEHFRDFYEDVLPEFSKIGEVVQFKVSCNYEPHLRGNVYVQFSTEEECAKAYRAFNGRWYAQKQLSCEFCPVQKWKTAICGLFTYKRCPKGKRCNFLHVFRNPGGAFSWADQDRSHLSPSPRRRSSYNDWSYRRDSRHRSRSRERHCSRSRNRHRSRRSRSRSEERRRKRKRRLKVSRSRSRSKSRSRHRTTRTRESQMKGRSRSRSRSPKKQSSPSGSKSRPQSPPNSPSKSRENPSSKKKKKSKKRRQSRSRSKSASDEEHSYLLKQHKRKKSHSSGKTKRKSHKSGSDTCSHDDVKSSTKGKAGGGDYVEETKPAVLPDSTGDPCQLCKGDSLTGRDQVSPRPAGITEDNLKTNTVATPRDLEGSKEEAGIVAKGILGTQPELSLVTTESES